MKLVLTCIATLAATALISGTAQASEALAKAKNCMGCHTVDKKLVGPAYKDVAKKYAGNKGAEAELAKRIKGGSSGLWGGAPMPPNTNVSDGEATTLAKWVLSLK